MNTLDKTTEKQIELIKNLFAQQIQDFSNDCSLQSKLEDEAEAFFQILEELLASQCFNRDNKKFNLLENLSKNDDIFCVKSTLRNYLNKYLDRFKRFQQVIVEADNGDLCLCERGDFEMWSSGLIDSDEFDEQVIDRIVPSETLSDSKCRFGRDLIEKYRSLNIESHRQVEDLINNDNLFLEEALNKVCFG